MNKVCAFFGHSMFVFCRLNYDKLKNTIEKHILSGFSTFLIGCYGEFDKMSLRACLDLKDKYPEIKICKVYANISKLMKEKGINTKIEYISYPVEHFHYKNRIIQTNKIMVNNADLIICYDDIEITNSGAFKAINYAYKQNKKVVNLF